MASPFSREVFNTREEVVSQDLMRLQSLASRDVQNMEGNRSRSWDVAPGSAPSVPSDLLAASGSPIPSVGQAPIIAFTSGFSMALGAGDGFLFSSSSVTADDSSYQVLRWPSQAITFTNPNGAQARIDIVYAEIAQVAADTTVRNILVDPAARTVAAQAVNKTANPLATIGIKAGTPAAVPLVPALTSPTTQLPLFYVWVPAAAGTAGSFGVCRAAWRRATYPFTGTTGVMSGMGLKWDLTVDNGVGSAGVRAPGLHRIFIDGELMEFIGMFDTLSTTGMFVVDTAHNPFGSAAPAAWHKPYYFYAVGGRNAPMPAHSSIDGTLAPVTIVESTLVPNADTGRASNTMTVNGVTIPVEATCYIGLGFVSANTTRRLGCIMDDTWTTFGTKSANNKLALTKVGAGNESMGAPTSKPSVSTRAKVSLFTATAGAGGFFTLFPDDGSGAAFAPSWGDARSAQLSTFNPTTAGTAICTGELQWPAGATATVWLGGAAGDTAQVSFIGYDHRVLRFGSRVNS